MPNKKRLVVVGKLFLISMFIVSPQIFFHNSIIISADTIFHLNRFYDTYMQIREHNFQPFIMMYGFGGVGRYINVLYGPIFAYACGFLLWILKSYYRLQLVLNFIVVFTSVSATYYMLKVGGIKDKKLLLIGPTIYATSFAITSWVIDNEFLGVGASVLPLAVAVAIRMADGKRSKNVNIAEMALTMIVLMQLHILSSIIGLSLICVTFIYTMIVQKGKRLLIVRDSVISAVITLIGTVNVWGVYLILNSQDKLMTPYPYANPQASVLKWGATTGNAALPPAIALTLAFAVGIAILRRDAMNRDQQFLEWVGIGYLLLASGIFPWNDLFKILPAMYILQFPFRIAPVGILLVIYGMLSVLQNGQQLNHNFKVMAIILMGLTCVSAMDTVSRFSDALNRWNVSAKPLGAVGYITYRGQKDYAIQGAFSSRDLNAPWKILAKPIPDYLPATRQMEKLNKPGSLKNRNNNLYQMFKGIEGLYLNENNFSRSVKDGWINIKWNQRKSAYVTVPVVRYQGTRYVLNGRSLSTNKVKLGKMGSTKVYCKKGHNELKVKYVFQINR